MSRRRIIIIVACSLIGAAQVPVAVPAKVAEIAAALGESAPVINEVAALKLDKFLLEMDNRRLRIDQLQTELAKIQTDAQAYAQTLQKPGYTLTRQQDGAWVYTKVEPPKPAEKK